MLPDWIGGWAVVVALILATCTICLGVACSEEPATLDPTEPHGFLPDMFDPWRCTLCGRDSDDPIHPREGVTDATPHTAS